MGTIDFATYSEAISAAALDADEWFAELDERIIAMGHETCITRVQGIHRDGAYLWIQLACEDYKSERNVVLRVNGRTTKSDVLAALRSSSQNDSLFEIIHVHHKP
jgi:hypothetical protein